MVAAAAWERYVEQPLTLADVAREMGCKPDELQAAIRALGAKQVLDPILLALGKERPIPLRREHVEESWPVLMGVLVK